MLLGFIYPMAGLAKPYGRLPCTPIIFSWLNPASKPITEIAKPFAQMKEGKGALARKKETGGEASATWIREIARAISEDDRLCVRQPLSLPHIIYRGQHIKCNKTSGYLLPPLSPPPPHSSPPVPLAHAEHRACSLSEPFRLIQFLSILQRLCSHILSHIAAPHPVGHPLPPLPITSAPSQLPPASSIGAEREGHNVAHVRGSYREHRCGAVITW